MKIKASKMRKVIIILVGYMIVCKAFAFKVSISPGDSYTAVVNDYAISNGRSALNTGVGVGFGVQSSGDRLELQQEYNTNGLYLRLDNYDLGIVDNKSTDSVLAAYENGKLVNCVNNTNKAFTCYEGSIFGSNVKYDSFYANANLHSISIYASPNATPGEYTIPYGIASIQYISYRVGAWQEIYSSSITVEVLNRTCTLRPVTTIDLGFILKNKTRIIDTSLDFKCDSPSLPYGASWSFKEVSKQGGTGVQIKVLDKDFRELYQNTTYTDLNKLNEIKVKTSVSKDAPAGEFSKSFLFTVTYS